MASDYDYKFITEPDDGLTCRICLAVARDPWQDVKCGVLFCDKCIEEHGRDKACPHCRNEQPEYFKDSKSKRDINALRVRCDNVDRGCKWEGTVGTLDNHVIEVCQFTSVTCPKECEDGTVTRCIMKKDLKEHLTKKCPNREHQCEYCGKKDTYVSITDEHDKICEKKIVPCTNTGCTMTMERGKVKPHVANDCEYTEISCKYESIGCDVKMKRRDMKVHEEDDKVHLHMALDTMVKSKKAEGINNTVSTTFKLTDYQKRKDNNERFISPSFYTSPTKYHMHCETHPNGYGGLDGTSGVGTHISVFARILEGKYDEELKWPLIAKVSMELLNQSEDNNHYKKGFDLTPEIDLKCGGQDNWGYPQFIPHSQLSHDPATNTQYLKDDTLYFRVSVELSDYKPWLECRTTYC